MVDPATLKSDEARIYAGQGKNDLRLVLLEWQLSPKVAATASDPLQTLANHAIGALDRVASTYKVELVVNPLMKPDLAALVATLTMFLGVFLLSSTSLGLVLVAVGALIMLAALVQALRKTQ